MQVSFGVIMLAIVNGQPRELGLVDALKKLLDHRMDVVASRLGLHAAQSARRNICCSDSEGARQHRRRNPVDPRGEESERRARAIARFRVAEQAQAIIELQLQRLTAWAKQKILDELAEIQIKIKEYTEILGAEKGFARPDYQRAERSPKRFRR